MISPFEIYLVMQLDSLVGLAIGFSILFGAATLFAVFAVFDDCDRPILALSVTAGPFLVAVLTAALLPSSKTAAAMVVIPAIANNEKIQDEAGELYQLAKQGLTQVIADGSKTESKE
ncbi:MAG: hypothetical protein ACN6O2_01435 [Stenotrophomonas sp.]